MRPELLLEQRTLNLHSVIGNFWEISKLALLEDVPDLLPSKKASSSAPTGYTRGEFHSPATYLDF